MLVGAGEEEYVFAEHALTARDGVADDGRIGVSDVGARVHVIDRRGDEERLASFFLSLVHLLSLVGMPEDFLVRLFVGVAVAMRGVVLVLDARAIYLVIGGYVLHRALSRKWSGTSKIKSRRKPELSMIGN